MVLMLAAFAVIALFDIVPVVKQRAWRDVAAVSWVYVAALAISILLVLHVQIPSLMELIGDVLKSIGLSWQSG